VFDHGDWIGVCDNTQSCAVMGLPADGSGRAYLSISRGGSPLSPPALKLVIYSDSNIPSGPVQLRAPGFEADVPGRWSDDEIVADSKDPALIAALTHALTGDLKILRLSVGGAEVALPVSGAAAALAWMDERQGRSGSATALVRQGPRPATALTPAPSAPVFAPAPRGSAVEIKPVVFPKSLLARPELKDCDKDQIAQADERGEWQVSPDLTLWSVPCALGAYNLRSVFFVSDARTGSVRPAPVPTIGPMEPDAASEPPSSLLNADFDPKTMILNAFAKERGVGDCGVLDRFVWDGRTFQPLEIDYMPECRGVTPEGWPAIYRGRLK
jgi:hypothetical protein